VTCQTSYKACATTDMLVQMTWIAKLQTLLPRKRRIWTSPLPMSCGTSRTAC